MLRLAIFLSVIVSVIAGLAALATPIGAEDQPCYSFDAEVARPHGDMTMLDVVPPGSLTAFVMVVENAAGRTIPNVTRAFVAFYRGGGIVAGVESEGCLQVVTLEKRRVVLRRGTPA